MATALCLEAEFSLWILHLLHDAAVELDAGLNLLFVVVYMSNPPVADASSARACACFSGGPLGDLLPCGCLNPLPLVLLSGCAAILLCIPTLMI
ncbi:hypothetical protein Nepgr_026027 [Nepenthes gracilis]|uniref:Uncharacterized protein n=1 Tax=Nepenthes gracilis TaxID=150966 RepID=A0AAD3T835_NEPGR|nr:hypothetical protein Nepgr_026027 [Nepenthes gracilis]